MLRTAREVREQTTSVRESLLVKEMETFEKVIEQAMRRGDYEAVACFSGHASEGTVQSLKDLGYKMAVTTDPKDGSVAYQVSWRK